MNTKTETVDRAAVQTLHRAYIDWVKSPPRQLASFADFGQFAVARLQEQGFGVVAGVETPRDHAYQPGFDGNPKLCGWRSVEGTVCAAPEQYRWHRDAPQAAVTTSRRPNDG